MKRMLRFRIFIGFIFYFTFACIMMFEDVKHWALRRGLLTPRLAINEKDDGQKFVPLDDHEALRHVTKGGEYTPRDVTSRERTAIIVPYRDRPQHRKVFLRHMHSFLQHQNISYMVFFVEMTMPTTFNRALLINVGFLIAEKMRNFTCYVFHDVDLLPVNDVNHYACSGAAIHFAKENRKYKYRLPYPNYIGGVFGLPGSLFRKINGFSNGFFGWGKEDDDLFRRLQVSEIELTRPPDGVGRYHALDHDWEDGNHYNTEGPDLFYCKTSWETDGLNSVKYEEISREFLPLYTWILIKVNEATVMNGVEISQECLEQRQSQLANNFIFVLEIGVVLALVVALAPVIRTSRIYGMIRR